MCSTTSSASRTPGASTRRWANSGPRTTKQKLSQPNFVFTEPAAAQFAISFMSVDATMPAALFQPSYANASARPNCRNRLAPVMMSGALLAMLPMIALFFVLQRQFIEGIALTGSKG